MLDVVLRVAVKNSTAVNLSFRMSAHPEAVSNGEMEKRIELEKRGRPTDEVGGVQVKWAVAGGV